MPVQYLKLLLWVLVCLFDVVLDLLDKFIIRLVGVAGVSALVGYTTAGAAL